MIKNMFLYNLKKGINNMITMLLKKTYLPILRKKVTGTYTKLLTERYFLGGGIKYDFYFVLHLIGNS